MQLSRRTPHRAGALAVLVVLAGCSGPTGGDGGSGGGSGSDGGTSGAGAEVAQPGAPDLPLAVDAKVAPDATPSEGAFCRLDPAIAPITYCPVRVVRQDAQTPPAVRLDLVVSYPGALAHFLGAAVFPCGTPSCAPAFAPPASLATGHSVTLSPALSAEWNGVGSVALSTDGDTVALSTAVASDLGIDAVVWLAFESVGSVPGDVTLLSAVAGAPPGGTLEVAVGPGVVLVTGRYLGAEPECVGGTADGCDDGLACTTDTCGPAGVCEHALASGACQISGACVAAGALNPNNPCERCAPEVFPESWSPRQGEPCDDADACTVDTVCVKNSCVGKPLDCADKDSCTVDACDAVTGCTHEVSGVCASDPCDLDPTQPACRCVVARARAFGCGAVFVWGDEHVTYSSYDEAPRPYWKQALTWLATSGGCGTVRTRVAFLGNESLAMTEAAADAGLTVTSGSGFPPSDADILILGTGLSVDPAALTAWIDAGGAIMFTTIGYGDGNSGECDPSNVLLSAFGYAYDCTVAAPWGPVEVPASHPISAGLTADNMPFVNGRWVIASPGTPSGIVARVDAAECP